MRILRDTVHLFVNAISNGLHLFSVSSAFGLYLACPQIRRNNPRPHVPSCQARVTVSSFFITKLLGTNNR